MQQFRPWKGMKVHFILTAELTKRDSSALKVEVSNDAGPWREVPSLVEKVYETPEGGYGTYLHGVVVLRGEDMQGDFVIVRISAPGYKPWQEILHREPIAAVSEICPDTVTLEFGGQIGDRVLLKTVSFGTGEEVHMTSKVDSPIDPNGTYTITIPKKGLITM